MPITGTGSFRICLAINTPALRESLVSRRRDTGYREYRVRESRPGFVVASVNDIRKRGLGLDQLTFDGARVGTFRSRPPPWIHNSKRKRRGRCTWKVLPKV